MDYVEMKMDKAYKKLIKSMGPFKKSKYVQENPGKLKDAAIWSLLEENLENMHKACDETQEYLDYLKWKVDPVTSENEKLALSRSKKMKMSMPEELEKLPEAEQLVAADLKGSSNMIPRSAAPSSLIPRAQTNKQQ